MTDADVILVTSIEAAVWTGRPQGTIWRWASEGRIKRHMTPKGVRYNLLELPPKGEDGTPPVAPPLPHNKNRDPKEVVPA
jgi:hypothetical protein